MQQNKSYIEEASSSHELFEHVVLGSVLCQMKLSIQSNLYTTATLGTPKKRLLFRGGRYSEVPPIKLVLIWDVWGSDWPLLTGGRCLEVVVNTGLTVNGKWSQHRSLEQKSFDLMILSIDSDPSSPSQSEVMLFSFGGHTMYDKDKILKKKLLRCKTNFFSLHIAGFYFKDFSIEIRLFV